MAFTLLTKIFGSRNDRLLKQYRKTVERINALEAPLESLSDEALRQKTEEFKARVAQGEALDEVLPEAFAVVREASKRVMKMRHFDVQLIGGIALHQGKIAEMRTGEGKTLTATLSVYLNALAGQGVCLCWGGLLDTFLQSGALRRVTAYEATSERGYFITHREEPDPNHPANRLREWILEEAAPAVREPMQEAGATDESSAPVLHRKHSRKGIPRQKHARLVR